MENFELQQLGCEELNATSAQDVNGGNIIGLGVTNNNGVLEITLKLDLSSLGSTLGGVTGGGGTTGGGGILGGVGTGVPGVNNLLGTVTGLLNNLLGGLVKL
ncbi:hypothetical protein LX64_05140 [Chitinophaga skermanii]|uniref:Uncharacterized protein n=1 Tax=Chitinophaga skermanii TaxID=331697 RepID=A0A327PZJ9_9BACT|nr:hypothetical protein [Chitinophaga skermanii]RAI97469.1 hypothetical protein LX64_05140 [Chitinophaga skermanii]